jgi:hypothetical protein
MPTYPIYSASLSQTGTGSISASLDIKGYNITSDWNRISPGKYLLHVSGSNTIDTGFTQLMSSGSVTGSLGISFTYNPRFAYETSSVFHVFTSASSFIGTESIYLYVQTYSLVSRSYLDNMIIGDLQLNLSISSGSV